MIYYCGLKNESKYLQLSFWFILYLYLIPPALVDRHVPLQLSAVSEAVAALGAVEALLRPLVPILYVLLQRAVTLVATCAVRTGEQLREGVRSS